MKKSSFMFLINSAWSTDSRDFITLCSGAPTLPLTFCPSRMLLSPRPHIAASRDQRGDSPELRDSTPLPGAGHLLLSQLHDETCLVSGVLRWCSKAPSSAWRALVPFWAAGPAWCQQLLASGHISLVHPGNSVPTFKNWPQKWNCDKENKHKLRYAEAAANYSPPPFFFLIIFLSLAIPEIFY